MRRALLPLTLVCSLASLTSPANADPLTTPANTWGTGHAVRAVVRVGDRLFVGGEFRSVFPRDRYTGHLATFLHGNEDPVVLPTLSGGDVTALTPDGAGGWFAAGTMTHAAG